MPEDELGRTGEASTSGDLTSEPVVSYATHRDYLKRAKPAADERMRVIRQNALEAFVA